MTFVGSGGSWLWDVVNSDVKMWALKRQANKSKIHCFLCTWRALHSEATGTPSEKQRLSTNGAIKKTWSRSIVAAIGGVPWFCSANSWPEIIPCQGLVFPLTAGVYQVATWRKSECHSLVCCQSCCAISWPHSLQVRRFSEHLCARVQRGVSDSISPMRVSWKRSPPGVCFCLCVCLQ